MKFFYQKSKLFWRIFLIFFISTNVSIAQNIDNNDKIIGVINGKKITLEEFEKEFEILKIAYLSNTGTQPTEESILSSMREQTWQNFIFTNSYSPQFDTLGIMVTEKETDAMCFGEDMFLHPFVTSQSVFQNQVTNTFDKNEVISFIKNLQPAQKTAWENFKSAIKKDRLRQKYEFLLSNTLYVTQIEAEREYENEHTKAEIKSVFVPYYSIPDSTLKISNNEINKYFEKNSAKYQNNQPMCNINYVKFEVNPSKEDTLKFLNQMENLKTAFENATNDQLFMDNHNEKEEIIDFKSVNEIPFELLKQNQILEKGKVYGLFYEKNYQLFKILDEKEEGDIFVHSSHILFKVDKENTIEEKANQMKKANKILKQIQNGASFEEMAKIHGSDGTKGQGGSLGWYKKGGYFVKDFEDVIISADKIGVLPELVKTEFGYHLVKINHLATQKKYKIGVVSKKLEPNDKNLTEIFDKAQKFKKIANNFEAFEKQAKKEKLTIQKIEKIVANSDSYDSQIKSREMRVWAFNTPKKYDISPVFISDNEFVIATLTERIEKNTPNITMNYEQIKEDLLKEKKQKIILKKLEKIQKNNLQEIAKEYGKEAFFDKNEILFARNTISDNFALYSVGAVFGLKNNAITKPIIDEIGIFIIQKIDEKKAIINDNSNLEKYKNRLFDNEKQKCYYKINQSIKDFSKVVDYRYKFY